MLDNWKFSLAASLLACAACMPQLEPAVPGAGGDSDNTDPNSARDMPTASADGGIRNMQSDQADGNPFPDLPHAPAPDMEHDSNSTPDATNPNQPCDQISCELHSHCEVDNMGTPTCVCNPGTFDLGAGCVTPPTADPATRTADEVCAMWRAGQTPQANAVWTGDRSNECDLGTLDAIAISDTVRRLNVYRWLSGLEPVTENTNDHRPMQECATIQNANRQLNHHPPADSDCYTADGAASAGRANLSRGYASPADALDGSMRDANTASLGHRRWLINGSLGKIGIGHRDRATCIGVHDFSGSSSRSWVAYPNPGPTPHKIATQSWSIHGSFQGDTVSVVRASDGAELPVEVTSLLVGFGMPSNALRIDRTRWSPDVGETYHIKVGDGSSVSYSIKPLDCGR